MAIPSLLSRLDPFAKPERNKFIAPILLAVAVLMSCALCAFARSAKGFETATLVEAAQYIPCQDACFALDSPASAFCFRLGDDFLVGEQKGYLHELKSGSTDDLSGKEAEIKARAKRGTDGADERETGIGTLLPPSVGFSIFVGAAIRMTVLHDQFVELRKRYANP
jgi:hypothetical protein